MNLRLYPIIILLLAYALGIFISIKLSIESNDLTLVALISSLILSVILYFWQKKSATIKNSQFKEIFFLLFIVIGFVLLGVFRTSNYWDYSSENHFSKQNADFFIAEISNPPIEKAKSYKTELKIINAIDFEGEFSKASGNAIVYFQKDSLTQHLQFAQQLIIPNKFKEIEAAKNPNQFDYKQFLKFNNIFYQAYFKANEIEVLNTKSRNITVWFFSKIYNLRTYYRTKIQELLPNKDNAAVASALILGDKQLLHKDLQEKYQDTGAMHILAVSGLHVGIISLGIMLILGFMHGFKAGNKVKGLIAIIFLWLFACLTGLAPSVTRATLMFSIIILGQQFIGRPSKIFNSLAASAFILLLLNPLLLMNLGFQLSYLAVIGIVVFHPQIMKLYEPKNYFIKKAWEINGVAFSAQILTLPITIATFSQFPLIFVLSNPIAILGATLILSIGLAFLISVSINYFIPINFITETFAYILNFCLTTLNYLLGLVQQIPFGTAKGLYINNFQYYLLFGILVLFAFHFTNKWLLKPIILLFSIFTGSLIFDNYQLNEQQELSIFQATNNSIISCRTGNESTIFHSYEDVGQLNMQVENSLLAQGIQSKEIFGITDTIETPNILKNNAIIQFENTQMLIIDKQNYYHTQHWHKTVDYILVKSNPFLNLDNLNKQFLPKKIIFDGSNAQKQCSYWLAECEQRNLPCHFTATDGAFTVILDD